jgi:hypothetical protein
MKNLLFFLLLITLSFAADRKASCMIKAPYNKVLGQIDLMYNGTTNETTINITLTNTTGLVAGGNGFHVHQLGVDDWSTNCTEAGKHYNPILNYGEISSRVMTIPQNGSITLKSNWLMFDGDYSIVGRSLVVHDNTTNRLGCCTIALVEDLNGTNSTGYSNTTLKLRYNGASLVFYQSGGVTYANITTNSNLTTDNNTISIKTTDCNSSTLIDGPSFNKSIVTDFQFILKNLSNLGNLVGRAGLLSPRNECSILIQANSQTNLNGNDFYIEPNATTTEIVTGTTGNDTTTAGPNGTTTAGPNNTTTGNTGNPTDTTTVGPTSTTTGNTTAIDTGTGGVTNTTGSTGPTSNTMGNSTTTPTPTATATKTTPSPSATGGAEVWVISMLLLVAVLLF